MLNLPRKSRCQILLLILTKESTKEAVSQSSVYLTQEQPKRSVLTPEMPELGSEVPIDSLDESRIDGNDSSSMQEFITDWIQMNCDNSLE